MFKQLIDILKIINENLKKINESIKDKNNITEINFNKLQSRISGFESLKCELETNIYTKEQTIEQINKEYDYRKRYEECEKENEDVLYLIQEYFNYKDKYQVLNLFDEINKRYKIERK